ncbi:hypothetical protein UlMin_005929 [Ulmus minor]
MRVFVILVSSSSAIAKPPNPSPSPLHFQSKSSPKTLNSQFSPSKPAWISSSSSSPLSTVHSRSPNSLSSVRLDPEKSQLYYFADLASKLARDGKLEDFAMVVESVVVSGVEAGQFASVLDMELVAKGVSRFLREGKVKSVLEVLMKLDQLGIPPLMVFDGSAMEFLRRDCREILKSREVGNLVELMETLAGFGFTIRELMKPIDVIKTCVEQRKPKLAIRYACTLPHAHMLFCDIIYEFGRKGDLVSALIAYEESKANSIGTNMYLYRTIIDTCGRCGDYQKSRSIYEDMLDQKIIPNVYVFNSLMNANAHDLSYTFQAYKDMQNHGVGADLASYNILLKACCIGGRVDLARDIYRDVRHLESTGVLKLDVFTYSTIVKVLSDAKLWQLALKVKEDMLLAGVTPNTVTWSSLISACANAGLVEKAIQLFEEMLLAGCEPNSQSCNTLLHACVEACQYDRAFRLFHSWKNNTTRRAFKKEEERKNSSSSLFHLTFAKKVSFTPTTTTYNILMKACGSNYYRAKTLMDEMRSVGLYPNQITWSILIDICGGSGNVEGALHILKSMRAAGIEPDVIAYTTVIKVCVESRNLKVAFALFEEMKRFQIQPNLVTYNTLLKARNRYGSLQEVQQCLAIYQDMRRAGYKSNDYYLKQLIEEWCEGVLQDNNKPNQLEELSSNNKVYKEKPQTLLLEKVAEHIQNHTAESLAIDLQGLAKVEARIVVLAVLRMVKENYMMGGSLKDDLLINLGVTKIGADLNEQNAEVKDAITKLLKDELGLVLSTGLKIAPNKQIVSETRTKASLRSDKSGSKLHMEATYSTRRPVVIQRLKVTKESLESWLQRKSALKG